MSRLAVWLVVGVVLGTQTQAAVLITEPFNQNGTMATGIYADWTSVSGTGTQLNVSATNGLEFGASDRDYTRSFTSQTAAVYFGLDIAPQTLPATGSEYFVALNAGSTFTGRFFITSANSGSNYDLGIGVGGAVLATTTANFTLTEQRIVGRYDPSTGGIALWAGSFNLASPLISTTGSTAANINGVTLRQAGAMDNGAASIFLSNLTVSNDFASAVAVPEPSVLAICGVVALAGCTPAVRRFRGQAAVAN